jgi:elongation factor Ts
MGISLDDVKKLREATGASMMACKKALEETAGDYTKAVDSLRKRGEAKAAEKSDRTTGQGIICSYIHSNKKIGAMVQIACETDFVAKNEKFIEFAQDVAMHVAAANPTALNPEDIDADFMAKEREIWIAQLSNEGKPQDKMGMILDNKEKKVREEMSLMKQAFVKEPEKTIEGLLKENITKLGENMKIVRFVRYEL